jgi:hypothetical protein
MISGILNSDLKLSELRALTADLRRDPNFIDDLSLALSGCISVLETVPPKALDEHSQLDLMDTVTKNDIERALEVINRRRMSKREVVALLTEAQPKFGGHRVDKNKTMRELVRDFARESSYEGLVHFLVELGIRPTVPDPYLEGIGQKR